MTIPFEGLIFCIRRVQAKKNQKVAECIARHYISEKTPYNRDKSDRRSMGVNVMLVILTDEHILDPGSVCQGCLLANQQGQPRWREGKLGCGHSLGKGGSQQPNLYECQMGFTIANIEG